MHNRIYLALCARDACEEDEDGNEEADAEVQVDAGPRALDGADQWERQDADEQANQWEGQTDPGDQLQLKLVLLGRERERGGWRRRKQKQTGVSTFMSEPCLSSCRFNLHLVERHEHREAAQVVAGAHGVFRVGLQHAASTVRPRPTSLRGVPEHTGVVVFVCLWNKKSYNDHYRNDIFMQWKILINDE